ncbi:MAG: hypothetical protein WD894_26575 [Pirellulales bacterium]
MALKATTGICETRPRDQETAIVEPDFYTADTSGGGSLHKPSRPLVTAQ